MKNKKADDLVFYEGIEKKEEYTNFQELQKRVELLGEQLAEIVCILRANNLTKKEETEAPYFNEDELFNRLQEEYSKQ